MKRFFVYSKRTTSFYKLIGKLDALPLYMKYFPEAKSLKKKKRKKEEKEGKDRIRSESKKEERNPKQYHAKQKNTFGQYSNI